MSAKRNLLLGILALQNNFINRTQLLAAFNAWVADKSQPLAALLLEQNALTLEEHALLEALTARHLQKHDQDADKSLAALSSIGATRDDLAKIADPDVQTSLATVAPAGARPSGGAAADPCATAPWAGATAEAGRFRILRPHAAGGLGKVSVAQDQELNREVALKEILEQHAHNADARARFLLEAEITGALEHPGIVPVYSLGSYGDGRPFYAMRFIKGDSLKEAIDDFHKASGGRQPPVSDPQKQGADAPRSPEFSSLAFRKLLGRFVDVCNAIAYAHSRGVLHRDLKPGNIMLGKYGETLVVDWGLAKAVGRPDHPVGDNERTVHPHSGSDSVETLAGSALGTPAFMSPEQAAGRLDLLGPASDVYSLGATLYALLTGRPPFADASVALMLANVQLGDFPWPRQVRPDVPAPLEAVCLKAMALKPADRYASARELAEEVERWLADEPVRAWPEPWTVKARRWTNRHRVLVSSAAACLAVAAIALVAGMVLVSQANADLENANQTIAKKEVETQRANEELEKANVVEKQLNTDLVKANDVEKRLNTDLVKANASEKAARAKAVASAKKAQDALAISELRYYASRISLAQQEWIAHRAPDAWSHLDGTPADLRGWEYDHLSSLFQKNQVIFHGHTNRVVAVAFSPDGKRLASASWDNTVRLWDVDKGQEPLVLKGHTNVVVAVAFSPDGKRLASASYDKTVRLWDVDKGQAPLVLKGHTNVVVAVAFSPDGKRLASASADYTVRLWDVDKGQTPLVLKGHTGEVVAVAFSPDGKRLASASADSTVRLWDVDQGQEPLVLKGHTSVVVAVAFSPDGKRLASASGDQTVRLWDAEKGQEPLVLKGHTNAVNAVAFSPDGKRLASASYDNTVRLWDVDKGQAPLVLKGHTNFVVAVTFSPDGKRLASASADYTVRLWDVDKGQAPLVLKGHTGEVVAVTFSPDGKRLASASNDHSVRLWDVESGVQTLVLKGHSGPVRSIVFNRDGTCLASASEDGTIRIWEAPKRAAGAQGK